MHLQSSRQRSSIRCQWGSMRPVDGVERLLSARRSSTFSDAQDLAVRARLNQRDLESLAGIEDDAPLFENLACPLRCRSAASKPPAMAGLVATRRSMSSRTCAASPSKPDRVTIQFEDGVPTRGAFIVVSARDGGARSIVRTESADPMVEGRRQTVLPKTRSTIAAV